MQRKFILGVVLAWTAGMAPLARAQDDVASDPEFDQILGLAIDDLTVTSVAKRAQKVTDAPAAVFVLTQEDLRRSGVNTIPEALRLVPGLQVAKVSSNTTAISSRGFNGPLANKLLVLIDGRSTYTPVFSGTYWDDQSAPIQDIDRIEVIRGPGSSLWGSNAVNGVVNIITKSADETVGNLISATGSLHAGFVEGRHGARIDDKTAYRTYAQYLNIGALPTTAGGSNHDDWYRARSGFRLDKKGENGNSYMFKGDAYGGEQGSQQRIVTRNSPFNETLVDDDESFGGNFVARWDKLLSKTSELSLQGYVDHYSRVEKAADQHVSTADVELQHSLQLDDRNNFVWGGGARLYYMQLDGTFTAQFDDQYDTHYILSTFAQNEYAVMPEKLYLTLGSKFEYNDLSGVEFEPTARLAWHPTNNQTIWGAISRAVRTPSSIEQDISLAFQVQPTTPLTELRVVGNPEQKSEELIAYELGHRIQTSRNLSLDTALFYNDFDNIQTIGLPGAAFTNNIGDNVVPLMLNNLGEGKVYGVEFSANWNVTPDWRLIGSYTFMKMNLDTDPGTFSSLDAAEDLAPKHQFSIRSNINLTDTVHWDQSVYFVDDLSPTVGSYTRVDTRLAWLALPGLELSLIGRNLLDPQHPEFPTNPQTEVRRGFVGQIMWKF